MSGLRVVLVCSLLLVPSVASANYTDGKVALSAGRINDAVAAFRASAWREDDLYSQRELSTIYAKGTDVTKDLVESAVWDLITICNKSISGFTIISTYDALSQKDLALQGLQRKWSVLLPEQRVDVEKRVVYILASRGAQGLIVLGELYDPFRGRIRALRDGEIAQAFRSDLANLKIKEAKLNAASQVVGEITAALEPRYFTRPPQSGDVHEALVRPRMIDENAVESLAFYMRAGKYGHPLADLLIKNMKAKLEEINAIDDSFDLDDVVQAAMTRANSWQSPLERYPVHSDESERVYVQKEPKQFLSLVHYQSALKSLGFYKGPLDGLWGPATEQAIKVFQKKYGFPQSYPMSKHKNLSSKQRLALIKEAAIRGHRESQSTLALTYYRGVGVPKDFVRARRWFEQASAQQEKSALFNLAIMCREGQGGPKDANKAKVLFLRALKAGYPKKYVQPYLNETARY